VWTCEVCVRRIVVEARSRLGKLRGNAYHWALARTPQPLRPPAQVEPPGGVETLAGTERTAAPLPFPLII